VSGDLTVVFPGLTRSGKDKLASADARGVQLPETVREYLRKIPSVLCGRFSDAAVPISFDLGSAPEVQCVWITINDELEVADSVLTTLGAVAEWKVEVPIPMKVAEPQENASVSSGAVFVAGEPRRGDVS
jgi:hypothetical protein